MIRVWPWLLLVGLAGCQSDQVPADRSGSAASAASTQFFAEGQEVVVSADSPRGRALALHTLVYSDAPVLPSASGQVAYDETRTVRVSSPIAGRVVASPRNLGDKVSKGDVLLRLDSPDFNTALAAVEKSEADSKLAKEAFARAKVLFEGKVLPRKDFEQAQDTLVSAQSEHDRARKHLENLGVKLGGVSTQTGDFHLRAPINGIVTEANVNPGMEVRPDLDKPLYVLSDLSLLWLWIDVFEKDIGKIQQGMPVTVKVSSWPDLDFYGHVDYISRIVDERSRSIKVRCQLKNPEQKLLPTMHALVSIRNLPEQQSLLVPLSAVLTEGDQSYVFQRVAADRYRWQPVTLGLRLKEVAVVRSGLSAGDQVVANGALTLRQDMLLNRGQTP